MPLQINGTTISWYVVLALFALAGDVAVDKYVIYKNTELLEEFRDRIQKLERHSDVTKQKFKDHERTIYQRSR